jgi:hypothetical protein
LEADRFKEVDEEVEILVAFQGFRDVFYSILDMYVWP